MLVFSFYYRLKYGSYKQSHRSAFYEEIAKQFGVSPQHVYELRHGKKVRSSLDGFICDELLARAFNKGKGG